MKKYIVEKRETAITNYKAAKSAYEGMTLNPELNKYDTSPIEEHKFNVKAEAIKFLNKQENYYEYNGNGYGYIIEWWITEADENKGIINYSGDYDLCKNTNFDDFKKSLEFK